MTTVFPVALYGREQAQGSRIVRLFEGGEQLAVGESHRHSAQSFGHLEHLLGELG